MQFLSNVEEIYLRMRNILYILYKYIEFNSIDDKGAKAIALNVKFMTPLKIIDLSEMYFNYNLACNKIKIIGAIALAQHFQFMPNLTELLLGKFIHYIFKYIYNYASLLGSNIIESEGVIAISENLHYLLNCRHIDLCSCLIDNRF